MSNPLLQVAAARTQFVDVNGAPLVGGAVITYAPSTTTPITTYQDPNSATANANPITLDNLGSAAIWYNGFVRMIVKDVNGNQIYDQVCGTSPLSPGAQIVSTLTALANIANPTDGLVATLTDASRGGEFVFRAGNYAAKVSSDPQKIIYVSSTSILPSVGCWIRQYSGPINALWAGLVADANPSSLNTGTDNGPSFNAAVNLAISEDRELYLSGGGFGTRTTLNFQNVTFRGDGCDASDVYVGQAGTTFVSLSASLKVVATAGVSSGRPPNLSGFAINCSDLSMFGIWLPQVARPVLRDIEVVRATTHAYLFDQPQNATFENICWRFSHGGVCFLNGARNVNLFMCSGEVNQPLYTGLNYSTSRQHTYLIDITNPWGIGTSTSVIANGNDQINWYGGIAERSPLGISVENPHAYTTNFANMGLVRYYGYENTNTKYIDTTNASVHNGTFYMNCAYWIGDDQVTAMTSGTAGRLTFEGECFFSGANTLPYRGITLPHNLSTTYFSRLSDLGTNTGFPSVTTERFPCFVQGGATASFNTTTREITVNESAATVPYAGIAVQLGGNIMDGADDLPPTRMVVEVTFAVEGLAVGENIPVYIGANSPTFRRQLSLPNTYGESIYGTGAFVNGVYKFRYRTQDDEVCRIEFGRSSSNSNYILANVELTIR